MTQLALDLGTLVEPPGTALSRCNEDAYKMVAAWPAWPHPVAIVIGPAGSGRSHLAATFAERAQACVVSGRALARYDPVALAGGPAAVDDAHEADERGLFHLVNAVRTAGTHLLLTAPSPLRPRLPDLASRLRASPHTALLPPDDALLRRVIAEGFAARQLVVDPAVIDYLLSRMERTLCAAIRLVDRIDRVGLAERRGPTRPLAAEVLAGCSPAAAIVP